MGRFLLAAVGLFLAGSVHLAAAAHERRPSWAQSQIQLAAAHGLLGADAASFRPDDPLTAGDLADLVAGLTGKPATTPVDPGAPVTIAQLDAGLVRGEGLGPAASQFATAMRVAGLTPPGRFGTEAVARLLGFRLDHPRSQEALEPAPTSVASRAEAAYSAAKILGWKGWEKQYVQSLANTFSPSFVAGWQRTILQQAVSLIGYPYVWAGTSEKPQAPLGTLVPGGFDCSGFVWRIYKLASYATGTPLADTLHGRTTYAMSGEVPAAMRIPFPSLQPADVLFFGARGPRSKSAEVDHTGIYLGGGWMIDSGSTGVHLSPISTGYWATRFAWARRPLAEADLT